MDRRKFLIGAAGFAAAHGGAAFARVPAALRLGRLAAARDA